MRVMNALRLATNSGARAEKFESGRLDREWRTVCAMIALYCRGNHHAPRGLCKECGELRAFARVRLQRCVFGGGKPTCAKCPVHCYPPARRNEMKRVMRYAGPRMLLRHPVLTIRHWLDGLQPAPAKT
jgi:hypothetical protein